MPRPRKCRRVCGLPNCWEFAPVGQQNRDPVILTVDEYEAIRLIDKLGLSQEECGAYMNIARTTVQQIYTVARGKLADMLVEGRPLRIEGGDYRLCDGVERSCVRCHRHCCGTNERTNDNMGGKRMKIAIPVDETKNAVCVSFGRAPYFLFWDLESGETELLENPAAQAQGGAGLKAAQFVVDNGASALITVRCGENAAQVFQAAQITIYEAKGLDLEENLTACQDQKLALLTRFHAGYHGIQ